MRVAQMSHMLVCTPTTGWLPQFGCGPKLSITSKSLLLDSQEDDDPVPNDDDDDDGDEALLEEDDEEEGHMGPGHMGPCHRPPPRAPCIPGPAKSLCHTMRSQMQFGSQSW